MGEITTSEGNTGLDLIEVIPQFTATEKGKNISPRSTMGGGGNVREILPKVTTPWVAPWPTSPCRWVEPWFRAEPPRPGKAV